MAPLKSKIRNEKPRWTVPQGNTAEKAIRGVLNACSDCDTCRLLMDESCLLFPELYRLYDKSKAAGVCVDANDLWRLSELCTLCSLCPCPDIRMDVIRAKTERTRMQGLPLPNRLLADVQRLGQLSALAPRVLNHLLAMAPVRRLIGKVAGIHRQRRLPRLPEEDFFTWARRNGLDRAPNQNSKVAYFAGCSAGYLFPEVARAAIAVLQRNERGVFVPLQQCCGMPTLLEGDVKTTLRRVRFNLNTLLRAVQDGYDIVCSCPTCGFMIRVLLTEKAVYSNAYQRMVGAAANEIKVPDAKRAGGGFACLKKSMYAKILKDDGYFSSINPLRRIALAEKVFDLGEYLRRVQQDSKFDLGFGALPGRMVYYAPCHQREQGIGSPYLDLLRRIPGLEIEPVGGALDCCGMGGSMGFKNAFHAGSIKIAGPLLQKIEMTNPEAIITDCLSCRLQFQHLLPYTVYHPLEIIAKAYSANKAER